jgi:hypothetical protein
MPSLWVQAVCLVWAAAHFQDQAVAKLKASNAAMKQPFVILACLLALHEVRAVVQCVAW